MSDIVIAQKVTEQNIANKMKLGLIYEDPSTGKTYIYGHADGTITINDYVDVDPYSYEAMTCRGNGLGNGILCVARVAYTDNYYGWFEVVRKGIYEGFRKGGHCAGTSNTGLPTGTTGDENILVTANGNYFEYHILGAGQTILYPTFTLGTGMNLLFDAADDEGHELSMGIRSGDKMSFVVGVDGAFHLKVKFSIADVSGTDDCAIGFRKAEAYQANIDDYDQLAALNVISGDIKVETILNGGATTTTDTTDNWADAAAKTLGIHVSAAGIVTYTIDGAAPTATAAFTFDAGEVVVPFFFMLNAADLVGNVIITDWEVGQD